MMVAESKPTIIDPLLNFWPRAAPELLASMACSRVRSSEWPEHALWRSLCPLSLWKSLDPPLPRSQALGRHRGHWRLDRDQSGAASGNSGETQRPLQRFTPGTNTLAHSPHRPRLSFSLPLCLPHHRPPPPKTTTTPERVESGMLNTRLCGSRVLEGAALADLLGCDTLTRRRSDTQMRSNHPRNPPSMRGARCQRQVTQIVDQEASPHWLRKAAHDPNHRRSFGERSSGSSRRLITAYTLGSARRTVTLLHARGGGYRKHIPLLEDVMPPLD